jgi:hypothetical protein
LHGQAFDCYVPLFYLAFIQFDVVRLRSELVALYTADSARRVATETLLPLASHRFEVWRGRRTRGAAAASAKKNDDPPACAAAPPPPLPESLFEELGKEDYEQFDDYLEMCIEFGYVLLFAAAFPLAGSVSVACNCLEWRSDLFKLCYVTKRPPPQRRGAANLGTWATVLQCMLYLSVATNLGLFAFSSHQLGCWWPQGSAALWATAESAAAAAEAAVSAGGEKATAEAAASAAAVAAHASGKLAALAVLALVAAEHGLLLALRLVDFAVPAQTREVREEKKSWALTARLVCSSG